MGDWQDKVIELLRSPVDDLISLARLAGSDPADFYLGADLSGIDLSVAEAQALGAAAVGLRPAPEPEESEQPASQAGDANTEPASARKGSLALHAGARRTRAARPGLGVVLDEASLVVRKLNSGFVYGDAALGLLPTQEAGEVWPFQADKIADIAMATRLIRHFARRAGGARAIGGQDVLFCLPASATGHERRMIKEACGKAGLHRVGFVHAPLAIALGAGVPVDTPQAVMVLNAADSLAEIEVISLSGSVYANAARAGVEVMDQLIVDHLRRAHDLLIGHETAERIRGSVGSASLPRAGGPTVHVEARSLLPGRIREIELSSAEVVAAIGPAVSDIVELAKRAMEATPPELSIDISDAGLILAGPGASLDSLDREVSNHTGLKVHTPVDPHLAAIRGCARLIAEKDWLNNPAVTRD